MSDMSKAADALTKQGIADMAHIAAMLYTLTTEEHNALAHSPVCIRCNHRELLHHEDHDTAMTCRICDCEDFVAEGAFSPWHPPRYYHELAENPNAHIEQRMLATVEKYLHLSIRISDE
jgi:hypothetical protein